MEIVKDAGEQPSPRLLARICAELRPLLAVRGAGASLVSGSWLLLRRGWTLLSEQYSLSERLGGLAVAGYLIAYGTAHAPDVARFACPAAAVVWCTAAWWAAPPSVVEGPEEPAAPEPDEAPATNSQDVYEATLEWIREQTGDANGIHVSRLLAHAQTHGLHTDLDVPAFRAVLESWGFPVRQQLKVGRRNRPGIHRDDLPRQPPPGPSPEEAAEAATPTEYPA